MEIERSFTPPSGAVLPDLTALKKVVRAEPAGEERLDATYYDTPGAALRRAGVTLRRRTGGHDAGWHLKLPVARGGREELHLALGDDHDPVPVALLDLVAGWARGVAVAPVARIRTRRTLTRLVAADGTVLAELADDLVEGHATDSGAQPTYWREWELELVDGSPKLLDRAEALFAEHGIERSAVQRKIEIVLGAREPVAALPEPRRKGPAGAVLHVYLAEQVRRIERFDLAVRRAEPGGVHGMRKACRRLRSALAAYRPLLQRELTDPVRDELGSLARSLGGARDVEVVLDRLQAQLAEQPEELVVGPVHQQLEERRRRAEGDDARTVAEVLGSERYHALRDLLDALVASPPWSERADERARDVLPKLLRREGKRLRTAPDEAEDLHEVRKAAKRLRYAYEVVEPLWPDARRPRRAARRLTEVLGDHQDGVVAREMLLDLAAEATASGQDAFTWGRLHALEEMREPELVDEAVEAWAEVRKHRW
nr:CYTH and CHAD domain-containing protein [Nocardioides flavescens]